MANRSTHADDPVYGVEPLEGRTMLSAPLPTPDHVVVVVEENHTYSQVIGAAEAPYMNSLAKGGALFTAAVAETHPSQPNYLALFSGSTQGITNDAVPPHRFSGPNLASELIAAGHSFAGYSEDLPSVGYAGSTSKEYARKHNPWVNFSNVPAADNLPLGRFPTNFSKLPTVSFVVPNLIHDMHDGSVRAADNWLKAHLSAYAAWARTHNSLLVVTWDEDDQSTNSNHIPTIFHGAHVKPGRYGGRIDHYSILRTLEDMYKLPRAGHSAAAAPITKVWQGR